MMILRQKIGILVFLWALAPSGMSQGLEIDRPEQGGIQLTWRPFAGRGFLQQTTRLDDPLSWDLVTGNPQSTAGGAFEVVLPIESSKRFFRFGDHSIIFVDGGNSGNGTGTLANPFKTLALATSEATRRARRSGEPQFIYVFSGTYDEVMTVRGTDVSTFQLTFLDESIPIAFGNEILGGEPGAVVSGIDVADVTTLSLHGFNFMGAVSMVNADHLTVSKMKLASSGASHGIRIEKVDRAVVSIEEVEVSGSQDTGVAISESTGSFTMPSISIDETAGHGILLNKVSGSFDFSRGSVKNASSGNAAVKIDGLAAESTVSFRGSIVSEEGHGELVDISSTGARSLVTFESIPGAAITGNGGGGIVLFEIDGEIKFETPTSITNSRNGFLLTGISAFAGSGDVSFRNTEIVLDDNAGYNAGVEVNGLAGSIHFDGLRIVTNDNRIGAVGISLALSNRITVSGKDNTINATGGAAIEITTVDEIDLMFRDVSSSNTVNQAGKRNGITIGNNQAGTLNVTGTTSLSNLDGQGVFVNGAGGMYQFANLIIKNAGNDGLNMGVAVSNEGTFFVANGSIDGTQGDGIRAGSSTRGTDGGTLKIDNVAFREIGGFTANLANTKLQGAGNTAVPFSSKDGGGNTGRLLFNGGANQAP